MPHMEYLTHKCRLAEHLKAAGLARLIPQSEIVRCRVLDMLGAGVASYSASHLDLYVVYLALTVIDVSVAGL